MALDAWIYGMKIYGVWDRLDYIYSHMYTGADINFGRINIKRPTFALSTVTGSTWVTGVGIGNGTTAVRTGFNAVTDSQIGVAANNTSFFVYESVGGTNISGLPAIGGIIDLPNGISTRIQSRNTPRQEAIINATASGFFIIQNGNITSNTLYGVQMRQGTLTDRGFFINGAYTLNSSASSGVLPNAQVIYGSSVTGQYVGCSMGGLSLTNQQGSDLNTITQAYRAIA